MTDRLRECPFCDGEAKLLISRNSEGKVQYRIRCHNIDCDVRPSTSWFVCKEEVIERWNRRKPMDRIVERLEALPDVNSDYWNTTYLIDREDAIEIVKEGGKK